MENRRTFLKQSAIMVALAAAPAVPVPFNIKPISAEVPLKTNTVKNAAVLWYSQTGYTQRTGKLIAKTFEKSDIQVTASDIRDFDQKTITDFDLVVIGSPVFYYNTPEFVIDWIKSIPSIAGTPVASYVTFGGPEGNQHNAACSIVEELAAKQGVPVGINYFMNMSSFPLAWSEKKVHEKTWMSRQLPNEETFEQIRQYAHYILNQVKTGTSGEFSKKLTMRECVRIFGPIFWTKLFVKNHSIDKELCIQCGLCVKKCPVGAIDIEAQTIDTDTCVLCCGCINNCPEDAVNMEYSGERIIGYHEFLKRKGLEVAEPVELKT